MLMEGRQRRSRDHIVWQTVRNGGSGGWEGPETTEGNERTGDVVFIFV